ncbi:hypothetical protein J41TS4_38210 [Paenibacillus apis]|uniref:Uncharacterized protein n=1 Tax=Paenibacillus apis TaxID=1792174 RepID=A0A919Y6D3_9BACL|nr:hypothetical protein J41TS4_38210 [Paenibacillus apis]
MRAKQVPKGTKITSEGTHAAKQVPPTYANGQKLGKKTSRFLARLLLGTSNETVPMNLLI